MSTALKIGFLGAGKMASALAKGFLRAGLVQPENLIASDPIEPARSQFAAETGATTTDDNLQVVRASEVLFLAVKPAHVTSLLQQINPHFTERHLLISIAAGWTLAKLQSFLFDGSRIIRVMPNTPALVGMAAAGYAMGESATIKDGDLTKQLLSSVGVAYSLPEYLLDAVTGLSGSGPAYAFLMIEALSDGGVAAGLPRDVAIKLAAQTLLGSAKMVLETGLHPGALKDMVTSPGGTTIEGIHELEKGAVRAALINAVRAATDKSRQLGKT